MTRPVLRTALAVLLFLGVSGASAATAVKPLAAIKGATTWFVEDHSVPMIAMQVSIPAGSVYDPAGKSGLSTFAGSMLEEGAGGLDSKAFHDALANRAILLSVTSDRDYLEVSLVTLSENAKEAFRLLGLALQHPRFDADAVTRVRAQLIQGVQQGDTDPETVAERGFYAAYFGGHPYGHAPEGDVPGLSAVTTEDLRAFARTHWVRGGMKIAVAGDANQAGISALLASSFAKLPGSTPPAPPPVMHAGRPGIQIVPMDVPQPNVFFGLPALPRSDPDYIPSYVANYVLGGGGFASRLTNEVRVKRGLTYDISTDLISFRRASLVQGQVATRREDVRHAIAVTRDAMKKFSATGPTAQELADAKSYLTGSYPLAFDSDAGIAAQLATFQRQGLPPEYVAKRNGLIEAVTIDDVRRVAKRLFDPARLTIVVAGTPAPAVRASAGSR